MEWISMTRSKMGPRAFFCCKTLGRIGAFVIIAAGCKHNNESTLEALPTLAARYNLGDGYDMLAGDIKGECLNFSSDSLSENLSSSTQASVEIVKSSDELATSLSVEGSAEVAYAGNQISTRSGLVRKANFSSGNITLLVALKYVHSQIYYKDYAPQYKPEMAAWLRTGKKDRFRHACGDRYIDSVTHGAARYVVISAQEMTQNNESSSHMEAELKATIKQLINVSGSTKVNQEQKKLLSNFSISVSCHSEGVSPKTCSYGALNAAALNIDEQSIKDLQGSFQQSAKDFADEISAPDHAFTELSRTYASYPVPRNLDKKSSDVFFDYEKIMKLQKNWVHLLQDVNDLCEDSRGENMTKACTKAHQTIQEKARFCMENDKLDRCQGVDNSIVANLKETKRESLLYLDEKRFRSRLEYLNTAKKSREEFTENLARQAFNLARYIAKKQGVKPYNVMVHNLTQRNDFQPNDVVFNQTFDLQDPKGLAITHNYRVIVFKDGVYENLSDGSYLNWAFKGCFTRNGGRVSFRRCDKWED